MIAQRAPAAAPVIQASAEDLPLPDKSYDAALAINTLHHWHDISRALAELRRVIRRRIVVLMVAPQPNEEFWLVERYFPQFQEDIEQALRDPDNTRA